MLGLIHIALRTFILDAYGLETWQSIVSEAGVDASGGATTSGCVFSDEETQRLLASAAEALNVDIVALLESFGKFFPSFLGTLGYTDLVTCLGHNIKELVCRLNDLHQHLAAAFPSMLAPSFRCEYVTEEFLILQYASVRPGLWPLVSGILQTLAKDLYGHELSVHLLDSKQEGRYQVSRLKLQYPLQPALRGSETSCNSSSHDSAAACVYSSAQQGKSIQEAASCIALSCPLAPSWVAGAAPPPLLSMPPQLFYSTFPFHLLLDRDLVVMQAGPMLTQLVPDLDPGNSTLLQVFEVLHPHVLHPEQGVDYNLLAQETHSSCVLRVRSSALVLKGQMLSTSLPLHRPQPYMNNQAACPMHVKNPPEKVLIFIGSPRVMSLDELMAQGLSLSNLPLYDTSMDLALMAEQHRVQEGLRQQLEGLNLELQSSHAELGQMALWLEAEKARSEELLYSMLPPHVADELKRGNKVARQYPDVTILFSDVVGFTEIASKVTPMEVCEMLNELYVKFDDILEEYPDIYKVETIGDAYMLICNLTSPADDHADQIIGCATRMQRTASTVRSGLGQALSIRVGVHTGSVVGAVVGSKMPRWCMFGDTVNTASRMESHGLPDKIHISSAAYSAIRNKSRFQIEERGTIHVKGKGDMETYLISAQEGPELNGMTSHDHLGKHMWGNGMDEHLKNAAATMEEPNPHMRPLNGSNHPALALASHPNPAPLNQAPVFPWSPSAGQQAPAVFTGGSSSTLHQAPSIRQCSSGVQLSGMAGEGMAAALNWNSHSHGADRDHAGPNHMSPASSCNDLQQDTTPRTSLTLFQRTSAGHSYAHSRSGQPYSPDAITPSGPLSPCRGTSFDGLPRCPEDGVLSNVNCGEGCGALGTLGPVPEDQPSMSTACGSFLTVSSLPRPGSASNFLSPPPVPAHGLQLPMALAPPMQAPGGMSMTAWTHPLLAASSSTPRTSIDRPPSVTKTLPDDYLIMGRVLGNGSVHGPPMRSSASGSTSEQEALDVRDYRQVAAAAAVSASAAAWVTSQDTSGAHSASAGISSYLAATRGSVDGLMLRGPGSDGGWTRPSGGTPTSVRTSAALLPAASVRLLPSRTSTPRLTDDVTTSLYQHSSMACSPPQSGVGTSLTNSLSAARLLLSPLGFRSGVCSGPPSNSNSATLREAFSGGPASQRATPTRGPLTHTITQPDLRRKLKQSQHGMGSDGRPTWHVPIHGTALHAQAHCRSSLHGPGGKFLKTALSSVLQPLASRSYGNTFNITEQADDSDGQDSTLGGRSEQSAHKWASKLKGGVLQPSHSEPLPVLNPDCIKDQGSAWIHGMPLAQGSPDELSSHAKSPATIGGIVDMQAVHQQQEHLGHFQAQAPAHRKHHKLQQLKQQKQMAEVQVSGAQLGDVDPAVRSRADSLGKMCVSLEMLAAVRGQAATRATLSSSSSSVLLWQGQVSSRNIRSVGSAAHVQGVSGHSSGTGIRLTCEIAIQTDPVREDATGQPDSLRSGALGQYKHVAVAQPLQQQQQQPEQAVAPLQPAESHAPGVHHVAEVPHKSCGCVIS